jgi:hypothetical protein
VTESFTEAPSSVPSWEKPPVQNDGWHTPSASPPEHETHHEPDSRESSPKPELVQVETRFDADDNKGNK